MFETNGLDELILDMDEIKEIDDDTMWGMLDAGGDVIQKGHEEEIKATFTSHTGKLIGSPTVRRKMDGSLRYVLVYPAGEHHTYKARSGSHTKVQGKRKRYYATASDGRKITTNQDVGFVQEFGGHGNAATQWMRTANEKHIDEAVDAEYDVFDRWLKSHNL